MSNHLYRVTVSPDEVVEVLAGAAAEIYRLRRLLEIAQARSARLDPFSRDLADTSPTSGLVAVPAIVRRLETMIWEMRRWRPAGSTVRD